MGRPCLPDMKRVKVDCPIPVSLHILYRVTLQPFIALRIWSLNLTYLLPTVVLYVLRAVIASILSSIFPLHSFSQ